MTNRAAAPQRQEYSPAARAAAGVGLVALIVFTAFEMGLLPAGLILLAGIVVLAHHARS